MKKYEFATSRISIRFLRSRQAVFAALAGLLVTLASHASAGTIGISDGKLIVGTEPGDGSQSINASIEGINLVISGVNFDIVTPGCTGSQTVFCPLAGFNDLIILGGDGDDAISLGAISAPPFATLLIGGPGADVLVGSGGNDTMFGGTGDDVLIGGAGINCLNGGSGNNLLIDGGASSGCAGAEPVIGPLPRETATPEPAGLLMLGTGLAAIALVKRGTAIRRS